MPRRHDDVDWRDLMMGQVDAHLGRRVSPKLPHRDFRTRVPLTAAPVLNQAAARRGMSVAAYLRRAGLAFAAYDLGLDLAEILADEPPTRLRFGQPGRDERRNGSGHGPWAIEGLK